MSREDLEVVVSEDFDAFAAWISDPDHPERAQRGLVKAAEQFLRDKGEA